MKKVVFVFALVVSTLSSYSQNDSISKSSEEELDQFLSMLFTTVVEMDIDKDVYTVTEENSHFTADKSSGIIPMVVPATYKKMKKDVIKSKAKKGRKVLDKGEIIENGKSILFLKEKTKKGEEEYITLLYCKKNDEDSCLMITSFFKKDEEEKYIEMIKKAAFSAQVVKQ